MFRVLKILFLYILGNCIFNLASCKALQVNTTSGYYAVIREDAPIKTTITKIQCHNCDDSKQLNYSLQSLGGPSGCKIDWKINPLATETSAEISLAQKLQSLDHQQYCDIPVIATVKEDADEGTYRFSIRIQDTNDNYPVFKDTTEIQIIKIPENDPMTISSWNFTAQDDKDTVGGTDSIEFTLLDSTGKNPSDVFIIDREITTISGVSYAKGSLRLKNALDYEKTSFYSLTLNATDNANKDGSKNISSEPQWSNSLTVNLNVEDVDDTEPMFTSYPSGIRVPENSRTDIDVFTVEAKDGDRGINNYITYNLINLDEYEIFDIRSDKGIVFIKTSPDREKRESHTITITAIEVSELHRNTSLNITVIIDDVNDEKPVIFKSSYNGSVNEYSPKNYAIDIDNSIEIEDKDLGENAMFTVRLEGDGSEMFQIVPVRGQSKGSFVVRVENQTALDYEALSEKGSTTLHLKIIAEDAHDSSLNSEASLNITVIDINDNFPQFPNVSNLYIYENCAIGTSVTTIKATDKDSGDFGTDGIVYSLKTVMFDKDEDPFQINIITGEITVRDNKSLDRETIPQFTLIIEATDNKGKGNKNSIQITIYLLDVNDNAPEFLQPTYSAILAENEKEFSYPLFVNATDKDQGENATVKFKIKEGKKYVQNFEIDEDSGIVKVKMPLDYENECPEEVSGRCNLDLTIVAYDLGKPSKETEISVTITLEDVNDERPVFDQEIYEVEINETSALGTNILNVLAVDKDISQRFKTIYYQIKNGSKGLFSIDVGKGNVTVAGNITFKQTGNIKQFDLLVVAIDEVRDYDSNCTVNITINDVNNEPPTFISKYQEIKILENATSGTVITTVKAIDPDIGNKLVYSIEWETSKAYFEGRRKKISECKDWLTINPDKGIISVNSPMDRETIDEIELKLVVEDIKTDIGFASSDFMTITVILLDVNDNEPEFQNLPYRGKVTENEKIGFEISPQISAIDRDFNQTVTFAMEDDSGVKNLIKIDNDSGKVFVKGEIDREVRPELNFTVVATDSGEPPLNSSTYYYIKVFDVNDNYPQFSQQFYDAEVLENENISLTLINATDADEDDYGRIKFLLETGTRNFSINSTTGLILSKIPLDREDIEVRDTNQMELVITARDNPERQYDFLTNETKLTITIIDVNDNAPQIAKFEGNGCFKEIYENETIGKNFAKLEATDADQPKTNNSKFEFISNSGAEVNELFNITEDGLIIIAANLTGKIGNYSLIAVAVDFGEPRLTSEPENFPICVLDYNDHVPRITYPLNESCFSINVESDKKKILTVNYVDEDTGLNGKVFFKMIPNEYFTINEDTGELFTTEKLRGDEKTYQMITLYVQDKGEVPKSLTSENIVIYMIINPSKPSFPKFNDKESEIRFTEEQTDEVEQIPEAYDPDKEKFQNISIPNQTFSKCNDDKNNSNVILQPICYFIVDGNKEGFFELNRDSRNLSLLKPLDRETKAKHALTILATKDCDYDPTNIKDTTDQQNYTVIQVIVTDVNDNRPIFKRSSFSGGVTSESQLDDKIVTLEFEDKDEGKNKDSGFSIKKVTAIGKELDIVKDTSGIFEIKDDSVILKYRFPETMKGYFELEVIVTNKEAILSNDRTAIEDDKATVWIYVVAVNQMLELVLKLPLDNFQKNRVSFIEKLNLITEANITIHSNTVHIESGKADPLKTTVKIFGVRNDYEVVDPKELQEKIDIHYLALKDFDIETAKVTQESSRQDTDYRLLIVIGAVGFIGILLLITLSVYCMKSSRLERQLKAATATSFGSHEEGLNKVGEDFPTTNIFANQGSNPLYSDDLDIKMDLSDDNSSEASLEKIDNVNDFEGGNNNGGFSAMIEGLFDEIGKERTQSFLNEQNTNHVNDNFMLKKPEKNPATEL